MQPPFDDHLLRTHLVRNGFDENNLRGCSVDDGLSVPLVAFSHRPCDTRTACISAIPGRADLAMALRSVRKTGAPVVFVQHAGRAHWDVWFHKGDKSQLLWSHEKGALDAFFKAHKKEITPEAIFRAKTLGRLQARQQLTFVDAGTLEMVEAEAGAQLCRLIERMMHATSERLRWTTSGDLKEQDAQWLVKANFWLLAARLLHDKGVPNFKRIELEDIENTFSRVTRHYGATMDRALPKIRHQALRQAVAELQRHGSLELVSTETLAHVYENALITKQTRKALGTHSTPSWLVDYIFSRLAPWIEAMPTTARHVYEPTCGHAPFLLGALRLLSSTKPCTGLADTERHAWLKERLRGSEIDDFAREVARLSLTLADIPNPNGWHLDEGDLFSGGLLEDRISEADIIVANPPFEPKPGNAGPGMENDLSHVSRAAEMLRQIAHAARPGALVGFVMPQTLLDSPKVRTVRASLHRDFEWQEILRLPDKDVFKVADVESAVLIGRRLSPLKVSAQGIGTIFKNVAENDVPAFVQDGTATVEQTRPLSAVGGEPDYTMLLPDLAEVWEYLKDAETLSAIADVGQGFSFKSETDASFPRKQTQISETKQVGYSLGFYVFPKVELSHQTPPVTWLNRDHDAIRRPHSGYVSGLPQVVLNYARISRGPWRIAAYLDEKGYPATSRFLIVRPLNPRYSVLFLWAVLNSPVANAFSKSFTSKRDILAGTMREMPLPAATDTQIREIEAAAQTYREACALQTSHGGPSLRSRPRARLARHTHVTPELPGLLDDADQPFASDPDDNLRNLHWRLDAAVLRLYALPPELERRLLDYFSGHRRGRVPFEQNEYIPRGCTGISTLGELLSLTADWPVHNARRSVLIEKEYEGVITPGQLQELEHLQKQASLRRQLIAPYPTAELDEEIDRLKREGKWDE